MMKYQLIGNHPTIQKTRELIEMVSDTAMNVLILGETGTGKEVVARLLHQASSRRKKPFVKVNCAALPSALLESELFGYEKGAFTGAEKLKPGKFELASEGAIFLDEIGDMPMILQAKLLQVLQSGEFPRLGGTEDVKVNTWIISSTNQDLPDHIKRGLFREDLYYRLNVIKIDIPPLRERREDIRLLAEHFAYRYSVDLNMKERYTVSSDMMGFFQRYYWPGNVRELAGTIMKLVIGDDPEEVKSDLMEGMEQGPAFSPAASPGAALEDREFGDDQKEKPERTQGLKEVKAGALADIERRAILYALKMTGWNKTRAAEILKISYKALFNKLNEYDIKKRDAQAD